jgi:hypothetical protein
VPEPTSGSAIRPLAPLPDLAISPGQLEPTTCSNDSVPASLLGRSPKPLCGDGDVAVPGREKTVVLIVVACATANSGEVETLLSGSFSVWTHVGGRFGVGC